MQVLFNTIKENKNLIEKTEEFYFLVYMAKQLKIHGFILAKNDAQGYKDVYKNLSQDYVLNKIQGTKFFENIDITDELNINYSKLVEFFYLEGSEGHFYTVLNSLRYFN